MLTGSSPLPPRVAIVSLHQWPENNQCIDIFSIVMSETCSEMSSIAIWRSHILTCASQLMAAHIFQDFWPRQQDLKSYIVYQTTICLLESSYNLSFKQAWPNFTFKWSSVHLLLSHWPYLALKSLALSDSIMAHHVCTRFSVWRYSFQSYLGTRWEYPIWSLKSVRYQTTWDGHHNADSLQWEIVIFSCYEKPKRV